MKYTKEELSFILYNNRSVKGVVSNFLPKDINVEIILQIEKKLNWVKNIFNFYERFIEIDKSRIDINAEDIYVTKDEFERISPIIKSSIGNFSENERIFLEKRKIPNEIINKYKLGSAHFIQHHDIYTIINLSVHPILKPLLVDYDNHESIIIPLYEDGVLKNCAMRRVFDTGKLKYSLSIPDLDVWGLESNFDEVWICEGLFDMMALHSKGLKAVSVSSDMWSSIQLYKLLKTNPKKINILCYNDQVGYKTGAILSKFFNLYGIKNQTWMCNSGKDAAEIIFEKELDLEDIIPISITKEMLGKQDLSFDFLKYLTGRIF